MKKISVFLLFVIAFSIFLLTSNITLAVSYPYKEIKECSFYSKVLNKWDWSCLFQPTQFIVYSGTSNPQYWCPSPDIQNNKVVCNINPTNAFYVGGMASRDGIGIEGISALWDGGLLYFEGDKQVNKHIKANKCKASFTISGGLAYQGNCVEGCGNTGQCPLQSYPTKTFNVGGTIKGDACIWSLVDYPSPCCFGECWLGRPPSVSGSLEFYYEAPICTPNWICDDWGSCIDEKQIRNCDDGCENIKTETQDCIINKCSSISDCYKYSHEECSGQWICITSANSLTGTCKWLCDTIIIVTPVCDWNPLNWGNCLKNIFSSIGQTFSNFFSFKWLFG